LKFSQSSGILPAALAGTLRSQPKTSGSIGRIYALPEDGEFYAAAASQVRPVMEDHMRLKLFAVAFAVAVLAAAPAPAAAARCDQQAHVQAACCNMPCCKDHHQATEPSIVEMMLSTDPQLTPAPPVRQTAEVWFQRPVIVGRSMLLGRYVIEHDNERMARGEACTHIYAYDDRTKPVAAFHCTHLERERADHNVVVLYTTSDGRLQRFVEFQFAGETAAHGYPTVR
jgi:hypothetical protein